MAKGNGLLPIGLAAGNNHVRRLAAAKVHYQTGSNFHGRLHESRVNAAFETKPCVRLQV